MYKKCKVVIIATDKDNPSKIRLDNNNKLSFEPHIQGLYYDGLTHIYQHLYILSDDAIKEGEWCEADGVIFKYNEKSALADQYCQKIIATTDSSLLDNQCDGCIAGIPLDKNNIHRAEYPSGPMVCQRNKYTLPSIPQLFIEKYISEYNKGNKIEEVMVEYHNVWNANGEAKNPGDMADTVELVKLNSDNTINIQSTKDSWTREEVVNLINQIALNLSNMKSIIINSDECVQFDINNWIKNNL